MSNKKCISIYGTLRVESHTEEVRWCKIYNLKLYQHPGSGLSLRQNDIFGYNIRVLTVELLPHTQTFLRKPKN